MKIKNSSSIYLDYASTTPVLPEVFSAMKPYFTEKFQNPSSIYEEGVETKKAVSEARKKVAKILGARKEEIIFTGSGTESDNLALLGVFESLPPEQKIKSHFITTKIEHPAILETFKEIERRGGFVTCLPVGENGIVNPKRIAEALKPETVLVSIMYANNEIGTIQPIREISKVIKTFRQKLSSSSLNLIESEDLSEVSRRGSEPKRSERPIPYTLYPLLHTDASQAANYLDINIEKLGVDMLTLDGSKIYGPKGIGILYAKKGVKLQPIIFGGGQEGGLRSATENVPAIVGIAKALEIVSRIKEKEAKRLADLRNFFVSKILKKIPEAKLNGDSEKRLPNNVNICIPFIDSEFIVLKLDRAGIKCSSTSSCRNLKGENFSYVVSSLGKDKERECSKSSLRFTMGIYTTKKEVEKAVSLLADSLT